MIETVVLNYLNDELPFPAYMEKPSKNIPDQYYLIEKTGRDETEHITYSTLAIQSYAKSLYDAANMSNEMVKVMKGIIQYNCVTRCDLNAEYNFTDPDTQEYRYQAVFDIKHYE